MACPGCPRTRTPCRRPSVRSSRGSARALSQSRWTRRAALRSWTSFRQRFGARRGFSCQVCQRRRTVSHRSCRSPTSTCSAAWRRSLALTCPAPSSSCARHGTYSPRAATTPSQQISWLSISFVSEAAGTGAGTCLPPSRPPRVGPRPSSSATSLRPGRSGRSSRCTAALGVGCDRGAWRISGTTKRRWRRRSRKKESSPAAFSRGAAPTCPSWSTASASASPRWATRRPRPSPYGSRSATPAWRPQ
mmetsp:Transcript_53550/g.148890  ORF Transcript_53550/g.148890 Transcript_53550/m.148890 type:complete len:247 (+) Transcript_53550:697-1437(+)